jgi:hypothetical protein
MDQAVSSSSDAAPLVVRIKSRVGSTFSNPLQQDDDEDLEGQQDEDEDLEGQQDEDEDLEGQQDEDEDLEGQRQQRSRLEQQLHGDEDLEAMCRDRSLHYPMRCDAEH